MKRFAVSLVLGLLACTGGAGPIDGNGGSSSGGSTTSSGGSSSGSSGGPNAQIRASDFSQSCTGDQDCIAVYEGAICNQCGCANAAIARTAASDYSSRRQSAGCPETDVACAGDCADAVAICSQGTCTITRPSTGVPDAGN